MIKHDRTKWSKCPQCNEKFWRKDKHRCKNPPNLGVRHGPATGYGPTQAETDAPVDQARQLAKAGIPREIPGTNDMNGAEDTINPCHLTSREAADENHKLLCPTNHSAIPLSLAAMGLDPTTMSPKTPDMSTDAMDPSFDFSDFVVGGDYLYDDPER
jgi:hypothetical protein